MADTVIDRWKLEGHLYVWHYPERVKGLEGWHLSADEPACRSIADLIDRMLAADWPTRKSIPVSVPERMLVGSGHQWKPASVLLLRYLKGEVEDNFWHLEKTEADALVLTVGAAKLSAVRESLLGLPAWKDDFALGSDIDRKRRAEMARFDAERLWFWTKVQ